MEAPSISGTLHVYVALDWGDEIDLDQARKLLPAASIQELVRRRRTPPSFTFRPAPLHLVLPPISFDLPELGSQELAGGLTLFDFGAVSLSFRIPFRKTAAEMLALAGALADPIPIVPKARAVLDALFHNLKPAIHDPLWQEDMSEEYFVFQFANDCLHLASDSAWLAGMVHLEKDRLSSEEISEALRLKLTYSPEDLFIPNWTASLLIDRDCDETLQAIEFANVQLLEFRHIDGRLDENLLTASKEVHPRKASIFTFWRLHSEPLRKVGELKVEANGLFERTGNVLKLVGDPYLARVYRLVAQRFSLESWEQNIQRKLEVAEGVYQVLSDQASEFRAEFLELVVVILILTEIIMAFVKH